MPWEFGSKVKSMVVYPGELNEVRFFAKNRSKNDITGQTVPSVSPGEAALYLNKTECFCFDNQTIAAGETVNMPLSFMLNPRLPPNVNLVTLSYTFFDITKNASAENQLDSVLAYK